MPRPLGEWFRECDDWGLCGKDFERQHHSQGVTWWAPGFSLEHREIGRGSDTTSLQWRATWKSRLSVRETRMQNVHWFILGDKWLQDKRIQTDKSLKLQNSSQLVSIQSHQDTRLLKQSWCDGCKLQLEQDKHMASNKKKPNYSTNKQQQQANTSRHRQHVRYRTARQKWTQERTR